MGRDEGVDGKHVTQDDTTQCCVSGACTQQVAESLAPLENDKKLLTPNIYADFGVFFSENPHRYWAKAFFVRSNACVLAVPARELNLVLLRAIAAFE